MPDAQDPTTLSAPTPVNGSRPSFDAVDFGDIENLIGTQVKATEPEAVAEPPTETGTPEAAPPEAPPTPGKPQLSRHKTIKAFYENEAPLDIPAHFKLEHKVNGLPVTFTVQEVLDKVSSIENTDREWQKVKSQREELKAYVLDMVNAVKKARETNDPSLAVKAWTKLVSDSGDDPIAFTTGLYASVVKSLAQQGVLTDEQVEMVGERIKLLELENGSSYYKERLQEVANLERKKAAEQAEAERVKGFEQSNGMPEGEYGRIVDFLNEQKAAGRFQAEKITDSDVRNLWEGGKRVSLVKQVLSRVSPELEEDQETFRLLLNAVQTFDPTEEELEEILREHLGASSSKSEDEEEEEPSSKERAVRNLNQKARGSGSIQRLVAKPVEKAKERPQRRSPLEGWDDLL